MYNKLGVSYYDHISTDYEPITVYHVPAHGSLTEDYFHLTIGPAWTLYMNRARLQELRDAIAAALNAEEHVHLVTLEELEATQ